MLLDITPPIKQRDFRFETSWLSHPDFLCKAQEIWDAPTRENLALEKVQFKLKKVKKYLKGWGYNLAGNTKRRKVGIHDDLAKLESLEEESPLSDDQIKQRCDLQVEFFNILEEELFLV